MKIKYFTRLLLGVLLLIASESAWAQTKNVILMISDGQGFNTIKATDYYTGQSAVYEDFDVKYGMQTNSANNPAGYDPDMMAQSFTYAKSGATDSASAATAMFTGIKIWDGDINMTTDGEPITNFFETSAQREKSIGAVSSVQLSHATPAALYGHNNNRSNYAELAAEAVYGSNPNSHNGSYDAANYNDNLKVVMGAGHPEYDKNGTPQAPNYKYVGGSDAWTSLKNGENGWTLIESKTDFEALTSGDTPDRVFGVAQNGSTLQQGRSGSDMLENVPTLEVLTKAALNVLDNDTNGFSLMIEGGAVDWANHANQLDRMIEEQIDFNASVQAVVDWVDANSSWDDTLLIVTADHETGHLWGDGTGGFIDLNDNGIYDAGIDYAQISDNGEGVLPGADYFSGSHTNALIPMFAKGAGSDLFAEWVIGSDTGLAGLYGLDDSWTGEFIDNTSIFNVMMAATAPVPEPSTIILFGIGLLSLAGFGRKKQ